MEDIRFGKEEKLPPPRHVDDDGEESRFERHDIGVVLAEPVTVELTIDCQTDAEILDAKDNTVLGMVGEKIVFEKGSDPVVIVVRADGYKEKMVKFLPARNKNMTVSLDRVKQPKSAGGGPKPKSDQPGQHPPHHEQKIDDVNEDLEEIKEALKKKRRPPPPPRKGKRPPPPQKGPPPGPARG